MGEIEVVVPLRGLRMEVDPARPRDGASIVRADTVDVPAEARASEGSGVSPAGSRRSSQSCRSTSADVDEDGGGRRRR